VGLGAGEYVAFADLRLDLLRRGARFRALDFDGQQVLVGPVFVGAQFKGETSIRVGGLRFFDLDVLVATVHVPEGGVQGFTEVSAKRMSTWCPLLRRSRLLLLTSSSFLPGLTVVLALMSALLPSQPLSSTDIICR